MHLTSLIPIAVNQGVPYGTAMGFPKTKLAQIRLPDNPSGFGTKFLVLGKF